MTVTEQVFEILVSIMIIVGFIACTVIAYRNML